MCCEFKSGHHPPMRVYSFGGGCCMPHGHHHPTAKEEKERLESYRRDLEEEISRVETRTRKIKE
jgi:hypothetical protein